MRVFGKWVLAGAIALGLGACSGSGATAEASSAGGSNGRCKAATIPLTIKSANGAHDFCVEPAATAKQQEAGLMYRTDLKPNGGMLFAPYPPDGGPPRVANFWMKNTPTPLDIVFIRADGTIAHIAENTVPFSEAMVPSVEPIAAVLEIVGGRSADLGVAEGDKVTWAAAKATAQ